MLQWADATATGPGENAARGGASEQLRANADAAAAAVKRARAAVRTAQERLRHTQALGAAVAAVAVATTAVTEAQREEAALTPAERRAREQAHVDAAAAAIAAPGRRRVPALVPPTAVDTAMATLRAAQANVLGHALALALPDWPSKAKAKKAPLPYLALARVCLRGVAAYTAARVRTLCTAP